MKIIKYLFILFFIFFSNNSFTKEDVIFLKIEFSKEDERVQETLKIKTFDDKAPNHVKRIKELVNQGFYDGIVFHRVIAGFMAQTGDPLGNGTGGSGKNINAEFNDVPHKRGTVSMARAMDPNSADSQFFICFDDAPHLDGQYTVWGEVVEGMDYLDYIKNGDHNKNGIVEDPDKIVKMWID